MNKQFSKGNMQTANSHMKCCSTSLITRETKTITKYNPIPVRNVIIKKSTNNKFGEDVDMWDLLYTVGENGKLVQPLSKLCFLRFLKTKKWYTHTYTYNRILHCVYEEWIFATWNNMGGWNWPNKRAAKRKKKKTKKAKIAQSVPMEWLQAE